MDGNLPLEARRALRLVHPFKSTALRTLTSYTAVAVFEIGSLLCGAAPNMPVLILGRAISGAGGAGIFNSALMILTEVRYRVAHCQGSTILTMGFLQITTMQERARIFGLMGVKYVPFLFWDFAHI